jgi:tripartite-type tricarboxylate transporter receptor subunit TctC
MKNRKREICTSGSVRDGQPPHLLGAENFCIWPRALPRCRPSRGSGGHKPIPRDLLQLSSLTPRADPRILSRASSPSICGYRSVSPSSYITGAGGSIGVGRVARAAPDGYTVSIGHWQTHVLNGASYQLQYDVVKDFEAVSLLADTPQWIVARKTLPAKDLSELIAWLKENPGKATVGTVGVGGPEVTGIYFQKKTGTSFQFVPYRGGAPLNQDMLAGHIDFGFGQAASTFVHVRNGNLKVYAVMAQRRWPAAPDIPTIDEAGVPGLYASFWHGLWVPKGVPKEVITRLNSAVQAALADATVRQRFADQGQDIPRREQQTPEALAQQQKAEIEKWWPILKAANIKGE